MLLRPILIKRQRKKFFPATFELLTTNYFNVHFSLAAEFHNSSEGGGGFMEYTDYVN